MPRSHIASIAVADAAATRRWSKGIHLAGVQIPGVMTAGLFRQGGETVWREAGRGTAIVMFSAMSS